MNPASPGEGWQGCKWGMDARMEQYGTFWKKGAIPIVCVIPSEARNLKTEGRYGKKYYEEYFGNSVYGHIGYEL